MASPQTETQVSLCIFMCFPNNLGFASGATLKRGGSHRSPSGLMDGKIDGLTDDYIGSSDKISVILCVREMRQREGERYRE